MNQKKPLHIAQTIKKLSIMWPVKISVSIVWHFECMTSAFILTFFSFLPCSATKGTIKVIGRDENVRK